MMRKIFPGFMGYCSQQNDALMQSRKEWPFSYLYAHSEGRVVSYGPHAYIIAFGTEADQVYVFDQYGVKGVICGEIYEPDLVKADLEAKGYQVSASVGDLMAATYREWNEEGIYRLQGIFSLALWDDARKKLFLYRDSSCFKYLYYSSNSASGLTFSTQLSLLFSRPQIKREFSRGSLHEYLKTLEIYPPNTIYKDVFAAEPGCVICYAGEVVLNPCDEDDEQTSLELGFEDAVKELDHLLRESIRKRLDEQRKAGFFLSGGVDSSLLCSIGADLTKGDIDAFTVGFEDPAYNEMDIASEVAGKLGIRHHKLFFTMNDYESAFCRLYRDCEQPFSDPAALSTLLAYEYLKGTVDAVLDGTGADTLVGIMPPRYKRISVEYASLIPGPLRKVIKHIVQSTPGIADYYPIFDFEEPQEIFARWKGWTKSEIESLCHEHVSFEHIKLYKLFASYPRTKSFELYNAIIRNTSDDRIHEAARFTGIPTRFPYWDREVENFVNRLPREHRYHEGDQKRILRALLSHYAPRQIWDVPKHTFNFPFVDFMKRDNHRLLDELVNEESIKKYNLFDVKIVRDVINQFKSGDNKVAFRVWALLIFNCWLEHHPQ